MRFILTAILLLTGAARADVPSVVTDIAPVHSLTAQVMGELGAPQLLISPQDDPHHLHVVGVGLVTLVPVVAGWVLVLLHLIRVVVYVVDDIIYGGILHNVQDWSGIHRSDEVGRGWRLEVHVHFRRCLGSHTKMQTVARTINIEANTFKLKYPDGSVQQYTARDPENLKRAAVGDIVVITATEALGIVVEEGSSE